MGSSDDGGFIRETGAQWFYVVDCAAQAYREDVRHRTDPLPLGLCGWCEGPAPVGCSVCSQTCGLALHDWLTRRQMAELRAEQAG